MTNSLIPINQGNNLPDYLRELQYEDSGLSAGIAARAPSLGITTDKRFTITKDGKTQLINLDPDNIARVRVVLVAGASNITKAWYAKSFVAGTREAPDCFSHDSKTPAPGVKQPQCSNCASCPKNAFGSHPVTGRGKACGDRKMTVVVWEGMPDELITFNVPTMSMQALKRIDTELREARIPMQSVLVEMKFDPNIQYPVVQISAKGFVDQATAMNLMEQSRSEKVAELLREIEFDPPIADDKEEAPTQTLVDPVREPGTQEEQTNDAPPSSAPTGRKRRTKAQIEADNAAAAAANQQQTQESVADLLASQAPTETDDERKVRELQEQIAALQKPKEPEETEEQKQIRLLQEQIAALQKPKEPEETPEQRQVRELQEQLAKAQAAAQGTDKTAAAAQAEALEKPAGTSGGQAGSLDVGSLLDKWANS